MTNGTPRPDESDDDPDLDDAERPRWTVEGSAGRGSIAPDEVDGAARTYWEAEADDYQAEHGAFLAGPQKSVVETDRKPDRFDYQLSGDFVWGPEGVTEDELGLLGPVDALRGQRVLEVGCGAAQCSAWLAARGVAAVGVDIAVNQLRHARPLRGGGATMSSQRSGGGLSDDISPAAADRAVAAAAGRVAGRVAEPGAGRVAEPGAGRLAVVAATATALPFGDATFSGAFASYGAVQFVGDLSRLLREVRRVLRPGGFWVFSVTHPIRWAFPDDPGPAGLTATGSYFDRTPYVERGADGTAVYAEFHRTLGDYLTAVVVAGFTVERVAEPEWPAWNTATWGGWSPLRGRQLPGTLVIGCRAVNG